MAKSAKTKKKKAAGKAKGAAKKASPKPRPQGPTYQAVRAALAALKKQLVAVSNTGRDVEGPLDAAELDRARQALAEIENSEGKFICIQGLSPYR